MPCLLLICLAVAHTSTGEFVVIIEIEAMNLDSQMIKCQIGHQKSTKILWNCMIVNSFLSPLGNHDLHLAGGNT